MKQSYSYSYQFSDNKKGKLQVNTPPSAVVRGGGEVEVTIFDLKYIVSSKGTLHLTECGLS